MQADNNFSRTKSGQQIYILKVNIGAEIRNDNVKNVTNKPFSNFYLKIHDLNYQWQIHVQ